MPTKNISLPIGTWVKVSSSNHVVAANYNPIQVQAIWSNSTPSNIKPHIVPAWGAIARDFETGDLWMRNTSKDQPLIITYDEA